MIKIAVARPLLLVVALMALAGCGASSDPTTPATPAPLNAANINLIFVVSEDSANTTGDVNPDTANLTSRGLQRSLLMASFLKQNVLGGRNVTGIYALEPMTHMQAAGKGTYPDMVPLEIIEQFALLNQVTLSDGNQSFTANSYPIFASYSAGSMPAGVAPPSFLCAACQGLDFKDQQGDNEALLSDIVNAKVPGFYAFSAPWETVSALMANLNQLEGYNLTLPVGYAGPNYVYAISITPSGSASLVTFNSHVTPPLTLPCAARAGAGQRSLPHGKFSTGLFQHPSNRRQWHNSCGYQQKRDGLHDSSRGSASDGLL